MTREEALREADLVLTKLGPAHKEEIMLPIRQQLADAIFRAAYDLAFALPAPADDDGGYVILPPKVGALT